MIGFVKQINCKVLRIRFNVLGREAENAKHVLRRLCNNQNLRTGTQSDFQYKLNYIYMVYINKIYHEAREIT